MPSDEALCSCGLDHAKAVLEEYFSKSQHHAECNRAEIIDRHMPKRDEGEAKKLRVLLEGVLSEAGMQAHRMGCPHRLERPRTWDDCAPCRGCAAEASLRGER